MKRKNGFEWRQNKDMNKLKIFWKDTKIFLIIDLLPT